MSRRWPLLLPNLLAFLSSCWVMVIELVASRLVAQYIGSSLFTWTAVIGVVLAGISLGNHLGGRLADRSEPRKTIGYLFLGASLLVLASLQLHPVLGHNLKAVDFIPWGGRVVLIVGTIFFLPAVALGMIGPVAATLAVQRSTKPAIAIGNVYAWGAAGSIVGTFLTGFWLMGVLGSVGILTTSAAMLALIGFLLLGAQRQANARIPMAFLIILMVASWPIQGRGPQLAEAARLQETGSEGAVLYSKDSAYYHIRVRSVSTGEKVQRLVLTLDRLIHGFWYPSDPAHLEYEYEKIYAMVTERAIARREGGAAGLRALFIGGGTYTFPRRLLIDHPGSECVVSEIDPVVVEANHEVLGLARDTPIQTIVGDARRTVEEAETGSFDLVYGDAFSDFSIPFHLTTREFQTHVSRIMAPEGVYLLNLIDLWDPGAPGKSLFCGSEVRTCQDVFGEEGVSVFWSGTGVTPQPGKPARVTFVIACSRQPMDLSDLPEEAKSWPHDRGEPLNPVPIVGEELEALVAGKRVLTDDYAPVEQFLAPVAAQAE